MKTPRALMFAILCGLFAAVSAWVYVSGREAYWERKYGNVAVLIATQTIQRYQTIEESMLGVKLVPKEFVEPHAYTKEDAEKIIGLMADTTIEAKGQITLEKVTAQGASRISSTLPKEVRACTLAVNEISGVAGLVRPGDSVDVLGTFKGVDEKSRIANQAEVKALFQNLQVVAVGRNYLFESEPRGGEKKGLIGSGGNTGFSNVTVMASPRECMDLTLAQQVGELTLMLRSYQNRFGAKPILELRDQPSTTSSVTGMKGPVEISRRPRWLEIRGEQSVLVP